MTPERIALKRASAETVAGNGGVESAALFTRVGKTMLSDYQSVNKPDCFMPLDVLLDLEPLASGREGSPHVVSLLCRLLGGTFVALPEVDASRGDMMRMLGQLSIEMGQVSGAICDALANGQIEEHEVAGCVREIDDAIRVAATMRALLTGRGAGR